MDSRRHAAMWRSMGIAKEIYISLAVIIVGYTASMFFVIIAGQQSQEHLAGVSTALFPTTQQSQSALTAFEQQVKAYEEAVMMGDSKLLDIAKEKANAAAAKQDSIAQLSDLPAEKQKTAQDTAAKLRSYSATELTIYSEMATGK